MLEFLTLLPSPVFQSHSVSTGVERLGSGVSGNHPEEQEEHVQVKHLPTKCKFAPNLNFILLIPFYTPTTHMIVWKWKNILCFTTLFITKNMQLYKKLSAKYSSLDSSSRQSRRLCHSKDNKSKARLISSNI